MEFIRHGDLEYHKKKFPLTTDDEISYGRIVDPSSGIFTGIMVASDELTRRGVNNTVCFINGFRKLCLLDLKEHIIDDDFFSGGKEIKRRSVVHEVLATVERSGYEIGAIINDGSCRVDLQNNDLAEYIVNGVLDGLRPKDIHNTNFF